MFNFACPVKSVFNI